MFAINQNSRPAAFSVNQQIPAKPAVRAYRSLSERLASDLTEWWQKLGPWGKAKPSNFHSLDKVPSVSPNFPCPDHPQTLMSSLYFPQTPMHASKVYLAKDDVYQVGQSPTTKSWGETLEFALETGQGIVQIVSDKRNEHQFSRQTIAGMLHHELKAHNDTNPPSSGIRTLKTRVPNFILMDVAEDIPHGGHQGKGYRQYKLTLQRVRTDSNPEFVTVPLTQIGLPFKDLVLKADDIRCASDAIETSHKALIGRCNSENNRKARRRDETSSQKEVPLLLSKHGHGRNATVATYMAVKKLIKKGAVVNEEGILEKVKEAIEAGRAARPYFVHSLAQVEQLQIALTSELVHHKMSLPRPTFHPLAQRHLQQMWNAA